MLTLRLVSWGCETSKPPRIPDFKSLCAKQSLGEVLVGAKL
jgi:hypothetical protein